MLAADPPFPTGQEDFLNELPEAHEVNVVAILEQFFFEVKYATGDFSISAAAAKALEELQK